MDDKVDMIMWIFDYMFNTALTEDVLCVMCCCNVTIFAMELIICGSDLDNCFSSNS